MNLLMNICMFVLIFLFCVIRWLQLNNVGIVMNRFMVVVSRVVVMFGVMVLMLMLLVMVVLRNIIMIFSMVLSRLMQGLLVMVLDRFDRCELSCWFFLVCMLFMEVWIVSMVVVEMEEVLVFCLWWVWIFFIVIWYRCYSEECCRWVVSLWLLVSSFRCVLILVKCLWNSLLV